MHIVECLCPENITILRLKTEKMIILMQIFLFTNEECYEPVKGEHITVGTSQPSIVNAMNIASVILKNQCHPKMKNNTN